MAKRVKRRSWIEGDVREFKALARKKVGAPVLAKKFKRSIGAIRQKAIQLGISLDTRR